MARAPLESRRILVVEDDYMIAQDVVEQLEGEGASVIGPAPSVAMSLRLIEKAGVDAAVLDVNLGQENSFPVAQMLQDRDIPFLFSTGYNSADIPSEWQHVTVAMKPFRIADVLKLLASDEALPPRSPADRKANGDNP